jgi:GNAT superfamily N-acetyltransferase/predicted nucleic acid-binding protein
MINAKYSVLSNASEIAPFVEDVVAAADQNKDALGFFAASIFGEFAVRENLYVAVQDIQGTRNYVGHLMYKCSAAKAHVLQIYVHPLHRKVGTAKLLLDRLKSELTRLGLIAIYARVAEDLVLANEFWSRQEFYVQREARGGNARKRTILVRCHELNSPQLFAPSGLSNENPLGLQINMSIEPPLFLLDLNVFFDLGPRRARHEMTIDLFKAERTGQCRFAISSELSEELHRTASVGKTDHMLAYAMIFPMFPLLKPVSQSELLGELSAYVFPDKQGYLTENDKSDLRHIATAIQHQLAGLITNDQTILEAATQLKHRYNIQVLSPATFVADDADDIAELAVETTSNDTLTIKSITGDDEPAVYEFLSRLGVSPSAVARDWAAVDSTGRASLRSGVWNGASIIGYLIRATWRSSEVLSARIAVDEVGTHAESTARLLLNELIQLVVQSRKPAQIRIHLLARQAIAREIATALGFCGVPGQTTLVKAVLGRIVTPANWDDCRGALVDAVGVRLPADMPPFRGGDQQIQVSTPDGNRSHVTLSRLESLLGPTLICLPGRLAVITPVKRAYAEHLLGHLPQKSLLPSAKASLLRERHYLSSPRTLAKFKRGGLILFYESIRDGGQGAIVAVARIQRAYLKPEEALNAADFDPSVMDVAGLAAIGRSKMRTVTAFDNTIVFANPIPLKSLERLGCGRATDLITTHQITSEQLEAILREGMASG